MQKFKSLILGWEVKVKKVNQRFTVSKFLKTTFLYIFLIQAVGLMFKFTILVRLVHETNTPSPNKIIKKDFKNIFTNYPICLFNNIKTSARIKFGEPEKRCLFISSYDIYQELAFESHLWKVVPSLTSKAQYFDWFRLSRFQFSLKLY